MRALLILALAIAACTKDSGKADKPAPAPPPTQPAATANGPRSISIEAGKDGYVPDKISGKPDEKLKLVFTRTVEGECLSQIHVADGPITELPMNTPVEIAVTVPKTGKLTFACGMDMFTGQIVADVN